MTTPPTPDTDPHFTAATARAVRLTLAMEARVDAQILALRKGEAPAAHVRASWATDAGGTPADLESGVDRGRSAGSCPDDAKRESGLRERDSERLTEGEDFQGLLDGDFDACVDAIRAGLGLPPVHGEGQPGLAGLSGMGVSGSSATPGAVPHPLTSLTALRPDAPQVGDGGRANSVQRPCAPSVTAQERAPRHLPRKGTGEELRLADP